MGEIHVISENDLEHIKKSGSRIRTCCPIHHSRDRDLSIAPAQDEYFDEDAERLAGFGYCHSANCGATVLVKEWNPKAAERILGHPLHLSEPRIKMSSEELEKAEEWQRRELVALEKFYAFSLNLRHARVSAYLAQRGLQSQDAQNLLTSLGVGYIPPAGEWKKEPPSVIRKWCDRIIFPYTCSNGERGFIGRTLHLWEPGMDESEHKSILLAYDKRMEEEHEDQAYKYLVRRYEKTYKSGFLNADVMRKHDHLYICEGPFDALPLMLAGLSGVVSIAGTQIDIKAIPSNVLDVTLAFDSDLQGRAAIDKTTDLLAGSGITPVICTPPDDGNGKDWSERYRRLGIDGLAVLLQADHQAQEALTPLTWLQRSLNCDEAIQTAIMLTEQGVTFSPCSASSGYIAPMAENYPLPGSGLTREQVIAFTMAYEPALYSWSTGGREQYPYPDVSIPVKQVEAYDEVNEDYFIDFNSVPGPGDEDEHAMSREQFECVVDRIAAQFPDGCVISVDPPGYTLADRVQDLQSEHELIDEEVTPAQRQARHWQVIEKGNARFDPKKSVNWFDHGFKKDAQGNWYYNRKDIKVKYAAE